MLCCGQKKENEDNITEESFFRDCYLTYLYVGLARRHGWPCADSLSQRLNSFPNDILEVPFTAWEFVAASQHNSCRAISLVGKAVVSAVSDSPKISDEAFKDIQHPAVEAFFSFFEHHFDGRFRFSAQAVNHSTPPVTAADKKRTVRSELAVRARSVRIHQLHNRVAKLQALYRRAKARREMQKRYDAVILVQRCARRWLKWKRGRIAQHGIYASKPRIGSTTLPQCAGLQNCEVEIVLRRINDMVDCLLKTPASHDDAATEVLLVH
mmetsp:Transcript_27501/g.66287  ORF Transcript_27501/g.66287 Transcript_27501/m.66287 type:complete len:267 (+) Transcript_27501:1444-2244(+)